MASDFENIVIDERKAFLILKSFAGKNVYVKSIVNILADDGYSLDEIFSIYTPFKVDSIEIGKSYIYIYHSNDRIILNIRNVKSYEETPKGIKIILEKENVYHDIYFEI